MFQKNKISLFLSFLPFVILTILSIYRLALDIKVENLTLINGCSEKYANFITDKKNDYSHKLSFCDKNNKNTMKIFSEYTKINNYISFDYIGNPRDSKIDIYIEDIKGHKKIINQLKVNGVKWSEGAVRVPQDFQDKMRIVAEDKDSSTNDGWIGIGNIQSKSNITQTNLTYYIKSILIILIFSFSIAIVFGYFSLKNSEIKAFIYMSLYWGLFSLVSFYTYLISVNLGRYLSIFILLLPILMLFKIDKKNLMKGIDIFILLSSMLFILVFVAYSNVDIIGDFQSMSADRWHHLPIDNWLPKVFADALLSSNVPSPLFGSWFASDRPPLQTGFYLIFSIYCNDGLNYLTTSIGMQLLVIIFISMLLKENIKDTNFIFFIMILVFFNGFVFVHGLFVWPKLLSALYQGIAFYFMYIIWVSPYVKIRHYILFGISATLAFLSHGGSIFYLLSLSLLLLFTIKRSKDLVKLIYGLLSALFLYFPWFYYQKFIDGSDNRLLKWHLAGQQSPTDESFLTVLMKYYQNITFSEWIDLKIFQFLRIFNDMYLDFVNVEMWSKKYLQSHIFISIDFSYLFFTPFFILLYFFIKKRLGKQETFVSLLLGSFFLYILIWILIVSGTTSIHHGSHFGWFSGYLGLMIIVYHVNKYLFYIFGFLNMLIFIFTYLLDEIFEKITIPSILFIFMCLVFVYSIWRHSLQKNIDYISNEEVKNV